MPQGENGSAHQEARGGGGASRPIYTNLNWNGFGRPFESSEEAYNTLHIGDPAAAQKLQDKLKEMGVED